MTCENHSSIMTSLYISTKLFAKRDLLIYWPLLFSFSHFVLVSTGAASPSSRPSDVINVTDTTDTASGNGTKIPQISSNNLPNTTNSTIKVWYHTMSDDFHVVWASVLLSSLRSRQLNRSYKISILTISVTNFASSLSVSFWVIFLCEPELSYTVTLE